MARVKRILVDAGPLIALFDADDAWHTRIKDYLMDFRGGLLTTWPVITEVMHLLDFNRQVPLDFLAWANDGGLELFPLEFGHIYRIREIMDKYHNLPADLADATLLVTSEITGIRKILTIDSDFEVYRTTDGRFLENVLHAKLFL